MNYRRLYNNFLILCVGIAASLPIYLRFSARDAIGRVSISTAYGALVLLVITLALGPVNVLRRKPNPVSFNLRRDFGIWAAVFALLHTAVGLNVHLRGRMWLYFVNEKHNLRHDLFGFANDTGLISAMVFLLLLALSNDLSLRRLGTRRWKSLQRWGYAAALLVIAHGLAYQQIEARRLPERFVSYAIVVAVLGLQLFGWMRTRQQLRARNAGAIVRSASSTPLST